MKNSRPHTPPGLDNSHRTSPVESLYVESNEESHYRQIERLSLQYALQSSGFGANPTFDMAFNPKFQDITISTFGIRIQSLREYLEIDPYQIEIFAYLISNLGYDGTNNLYGLRPVKKSDVCPSEF